MTHLLEFDPGARVVVVSGYANDQILANHEEYGFVGQVRKPYGIEELAQVIGQAMSS